MSNPNDPPIWFCIGLVSVITSFIFIVTALMRKFGDSFYITCPICGEESSFSKKKACERAATKTAAQILELEILCAVGGTGFHPDSPRHVYRGCGSDLTGPYLQHRIVREALKGKDRLKVIQEGSEMYAKIVDEERLKDDELNNRST